MTKTIKLLGVASTLALMAGATPAFAAGTTAGSTITNTVTVDYKVDNIDQTAETDSDEFTVDRKVNLSLTEVGTVTTQVTPGQLAAVTTFLLNNSSNAVMDFGLAVTQLAGGTAKHGGTDTIDVTNVKIYRDTGGVVGAYDAGTDTEVVGFLDEIAADANITLFVVSDVPLGLDTGDVAGVRLTATARDGGVAATQGSVSTETAGANTAGVDTVLADTNANGNTARDGISFDEDDYTVLTAALTALKTSLVISDPFNGTTDPKMIPGAVVEYCVAVTNAGGALATNINISDTLPAETVFEPTYGVKVDGTKTGLVCNEDGVAGGGHAAGVVSAPLSDIAATNTRTVKFRVTVQ